MPLLRFSSNYVLMFRFYAKADTKLRSKYEEAIEIAATLALRPPARTKL